MGAFSREETEAPAPSPPCAGRTRTQLPADASVHRLTVRITASEPARNAAGGAARFQRRTFFTRGFASCSPKAGGAAGNRRPAAKESRDRLYVRFTSGPSSRSTASSQLISMSRQNSLWHSHTAGSHQ